MQLGTVEQPQPRRDCIHSQDTGSGECWGSTHLLLWIQCRIATRRWGGGLPTSVRLVKDNPPRIAPHLNNPSQVYLEPRLLGDFRFCQVVSHANTEHYTFPGDRIIRLRWKLALSLFYLLRSLWPRLVPFCVRTPPPQSSQCH